MTITANDIQELVDFLPIFYVPEFQPIEKWNFKNPDGTSIAPYPIYTESVEHFFRLASKSCWFVSVSKRFDSKILEDGKFINNASLKEIKIMLDYFLRAERYCDGFWASLIKDGTICALLERLKEIKKEYR
ncbi:conserved hypothetical protein [Hyella patelloides LEGE 07179]|uniref:Uncharacterized protein n=1 Tax=Hyella patelloides LEGE 07179 TaxID=945734 RepID=A0A563VKJ2_9CYAN|nr:DUF6508 domain-containing protein [Hyella patelloides]VEP11931.1 conserved hypothetical protein [Hyella patelloides LEGE 07179]